MFELTIILKNDDKSRSYREKFPIYEDCQLSQDDPTIKKYIEQCIRAFPEKPASIQFKTHSEVIESLEDNDG